MKYIVTLAVLVFTATDAAAQAFPPDAQWSALYCGQRVMADPLGDEAGFTAERDLVGDPNAPAAMVASDAQFLYLRMRVDQDPIPTPGTLPASSWGFAINLDNDLRSYEVLLLVDGTQGGQGTVGVFRNTTTATPNDPTDPAETSVMTFPANTHAQKRAAAGSQFGGAGDFWLEFAVPWSTLMPLGFNRGTLIRLWAASSTSANSLNGDFACHDGATGEPTLDAIISDPTVGDPILDTDGDGFTDAQEVAAGSDPNDPNSVPTSRLEGGGGCATGGGGLGGVLALLALLLARRRP